MPDFDLIIAYRVSPFLSPSAPKIFNEKLELVTACLLSFKEAIEGLKAKVYVIMDRCPKIYDKVFKELFENLEIKKIESNITGLRWNMNVQTFLLQLEYLKGQQYSEIVMFQEDDYLYFQSIKPMLEFISNENVDFISPYLHPWIINTAWKKFIKNKIIQNKIEWIQIPYTTNTFMTKKSILLEAKRFLNLYYKTGDMYRFIILTKNIRPLRIDFPYYRYRIGALKFLRYYLSLRKYTLWMPNPTIADHIAGNPPAYTGWNELERIKNKAIDFLNSLT
jgi:hypothetical protein